jgi:hypothetical protein
MSVYSKIKATLSVLSISLNLIECTTSPKPSDYIVYSQVDAPNKTGADGKVTGVSIRVQVDFNTKTASKIDDIGTKIETLMLDAGFMRVGRIREGYDESVQYFYRQQDFRYYERRD